MGKPHQKPITKSDIEEYLTTSSDFAFEIKVLNKFSQMGFKCEHSGIYEDPITKKIREFDIRGYKELGYKRIRVSVECKNLRETFPVVAHCVQRPIEESYHDVVIKHRTRTDDQAIKLSHSTSTRIRIRDPFSLYLSNSYVAKSLDQVGKNQNGIISHDSSVFDKMSQAINSAYDLVARAHSETSADKEKATIVLPILVVPSGRLWQVIYDNDGSIARGPEMTNHISYYVGQSWRVGYYNSTMPGYSDLVWYKLSHLEIITFSDLDTILNDYFKTEDDWKRAFTDKTPNTLLRMPDFRVS